LESIQHPCKDFYGLDKESQVMRTRPRALKALASAKRLSQAGVYRLTLRSLLANIPNPHQEHLFRNRSIHSTIKFAGYRKADISAHQGTAE
jgi:hypothetical protein